MNSWFRFAWIPGLPSAPSTAGGRELSAASTRARENLARDGSRGAASLEVAGSRGLLGTLSGTGVGELARRSHRRHHRETEAEQGT